MAVEDWALRSRIKILLLYKNLLKRKVKGYKGNSRYLYKVFSTIHLLFLISVDEACRSVRRSVWSIRGYLEDIQGRTGLLVPGCGAATSAITQLAE